LRKRADVIHLHVSQNGSAFRKSILTAIAVAFRKPVIMHAHGSNFHLFYPELPGPARAFVRWAFMKSSRVLVLSKSWKEFYIEKLGLSPDQVVVLSNPVALPATVQERKSSDPVQILYLGQIGERKGSFNLLHAFARLPEEQRRRARLLLAGDGEISEARALIKRLRLSDSAIALDWVGPVQRDQLLADSHVFVLPSYNEGLPMALLEAMACQLPVITTPVGGIPEVVTDGQNGMLVTPGDIGGLAGAMQLLIEQEDLRLVLGLNARKSVEHFDIAEYACSLAAIYRSVAASVDAPLLRKSQLTRL
jgi:glycosyltransferase involved in cell wall biosynthesis